MDRLKYWYKTLKLYEKIIFINTLIFIVSKVGVFILGVSNGFVYQFFGLTDNSIFMPWSFITYAFFHNNLWSLFWNSVVFYFAGQIFVNLFNGRLFLNVFFNSILLSGVIFFLIQMFFPFLISSNGSYIGFDSACLGVLFFLVGYLPEKEFRFFTFNLKLWQLGVVILGFKVLGLFFTQSPIYYMELLGMAVGYIYAKQLKKGNDIGDWFGKLVDKILNNTGKKPLRTVHKNAKKTKTNQTTERQNRVDAILDKISENGYNSLTEEEKRILFDESKN